MREFISYKIIWEILRAFFHVMFPFLLIYYFTWQSVSFANMNREIQKLTQKREELFRKNYDLKAQIASIYASERVENLLKRKYEPKRDKVITLTLPEYKIFVSSE